MEYLVVVSLGPVQSFIGSARKLEDFWSGSFLLSDITQRSIEEFENYNWLSAELIQPSLIKNTSPENFDIAGLPNRFLYRVKTDGDLPEILKNIESKIHLMVENLLKEYVSHYFNKQYTASMDKQINQQLSNMLELYWAFIPYDQNHSFTEQRKELEENLASVKNIRHSDYSIDYGLPCTMCAQRSALVSTELDKNSSYAEMRAGIRKVWDKVDINSRKIKEGEHLCAVCVAKRQQRTEIERKALNQGVALNRRGFPSVSYFVQQKERAEALAKSQNTYDIENNSQSEDNRYYAMVKFDGDNMGQWIAEAESMQVAKEKTAKLTRFAQKGVYDAKQGRHLRVIYSGGDDVLAVGMITDLLAFTAQIRANFSDEAKGLGADRTGSAGIVLVPETYPLYKVIEAANEAEANAKLYSDDKGNTKDAFCLTFIRRSGQARQITLPFKLEQLTANMLDYLLDTAKVWKKNEISRNFIYRFQQEFQNINREYEGDRNHSKLAFAENSQLITEQLLRLIQNLQAVHNTNYGIQLAQELTELYCNYTGNFDSFINLLEIISYLASVYSIEEEEEAYVL